MSKRFSIATAVLVLSLTVGVVSGQEAGSAGSDRASGSPSSNVTGAGNTMSADLANQPYRIGPGDVLDIRVFNRPQLSREVRVDSQGNIQMPMLDQNIKAACFSDTELAKVVAELYRKYQRNPYVSVFIKEFSSQPIAVFGAVEKPGQIILKRRMRLFDAITLAGGPSDEAGGQVEIAHTGGASICDEPGQPDEDGIKSGFIAYTLSETLRGDEKSNPWLRPGDYVRVSEAQRAYVIGNVNKPSAISLREPTTLFRAVARAEGWAKHSKLTKVTILRTAEGNPVGTLIPVDLQAIARLKAPDILLLPNDIVYVPVDNAAVTREKIVSALTGGLGTLPYLIP